MQDFFFHACKQILNHGGVLEIKLQTGLRYVDGPHFFHVKLIGGGPRTWCNYMQNKDIGDIGVLHFWRVYYRMGSRSHMVW